MFSLALSQAVAAFAPTDLTYPAQFLVDYVRVYQIEGQTAKVTCDPTGTSGTLDVGYIADYYCLLDFPTKDYITAHSAAYGDATVRTWAGAGYTPPTNSQVDGC